MEEKKYYALTYNKNYRKNSTMKQGDYAEILLDLNEYIVAWSFEIGEIQKRLHLHLLLHMSDEDMMICQQADKFRYKSFCYCLVDCYNKDGWLEYMLKEKSFFSGNNNIDDAKN